MYTLSFKSFLECKQEVLSCSELFGFGMGGPEGCAVSGCGSSSASGSGSHCDRGLFWIWRADKCVWPLGPLLRCKEGNPHSCVLSQSGDLCSDRGNPVIFQKEHASRGLGDEAGPSRARPG